MQKCGILRVVDISSGWLSRDVVDLSQGESMILFNSKPA